MPSAPVDIPTVVIGAGHAGLAMSCRLSEHGIEHVVLERGEVANSWRNERWNSLRLLTPNWQSGLPGMSYQGDDPDGYMTMSEVVELITTYASKIGAPVQAGTRVRRVAAGPGGYVVDTDHGSWTCRCVVIASGGSNIAEVPELAQNAPTSIAMVTPMTYRTADALDERAVLIVGASATGVQLADEIRRSGRRVVISVGEHVRMPRVYRGRDVFWWLDATGISGERYDEVDDLVRARNLPSPQLIGTSERRSLDLNALTAIGVELVGRLGRLRDGVAQFSGSLGNICTLADLKMNRMLRAFDEWSESADLESIDAPERFEATRVPDTPANEIDLVDSGFGTIIWATGYRPDYSWLDVPVLDRKGRIRHRGGVVADAPGLYVIGLNMLLRRSSSFIHGSNLDSEELGQHLACYLNCAKPSPVRDDGPSIEPAEVPA